MSFRSKMSMDIPSGASSRAAASRLRFRERSRKLPAIPRTRIPPEYIDTSFPLPLPDSGRPRPVSGSATPARCAAPGQGTPTPRTHVPAGGSARRLRRLDLRRLDLERDLDLVAHEHAAGLQRRVPGQAEIPTVDDRLRREGRLFVPPRILAPALVRGLEHDFLRHPANGQVADHAELPVALRLHPTAPEGDLRVVLHIEKVRGTEMIVPLLLAGVDARHADLDLDRGTRDIVLVQDNGAAHIAEAPLHRRDHHVPDRELHSGVRRIDLPRALRHALTSTESGPDVRGAEAGPAPPHVRSIHASGSGRRRARRSPRRVVRLQFRSPLPEGTQEADRLPLLVFVQTRKGMGEPPGMLGEDAPDEGLALWGERHVPGAPVLRALPPLDEPLALQAVHQVRDTAARDQDLPLHLAQEHGPLVVECLEDPELRDGEPVPRHVRLGMGRDGMVGPGQHHPELQVQVDLVRHGYLTAENLSDKITTEAVRVKVGEGGGERWEGVWPRSGRRRGVGGAGDGRSGELAGSPARSAGLRWESDAGRPGPTGQSGHCSSRAGSWLRSEGGVACRSYRAGRYFRPDSKEPVVAAAVLGGRQGLHVGETWAVTGPTGREAPTCPESRVRSVSWMGANDVHAWEFGGDHGRAGDRGRLPLGP